MITTVRGARGSGKTLRNRSGRRDCRLRKVASSAADPGSGACRMAPPRSHSALPKVFAARANRAGCAASVDA